MDYDRSRFIDREILDPASVMGSAGLSSSGGHPHSVMDSLDFLKEGEVNLGVRTPLPSAPAPAAAASHTHHPFWRHRRRRSWR